MERSFSRRGGLGVPGPGHFARESTPGSLDLRDRNSRTQYLDGEMQRVRARAIEQAVAAQASRERFSRSMRESDLLPFYGDPKHVPKRTSDRPDERLHGRAERLIADSMNEELDVLEESLTRLRAGLRRKEIDRVPSYVSRWRRQVDDMDTSEIDRFSPRTEDEQRWKASADLATWKHPFNDKPISPAFPKTRPHGHHPAQKPRYKDITRDYSLRPSWGRDHSDEELQKQIDEELEALLAKRRQRLT